MFRVLLLEMPMAFLNQPRGFPDAIPFLDRFTVSRYDICRIGLPAGSAKLLVDPPVTFETTPDVEQFLRMRTSKSVEHELRHGEAEIC